MNKDLIKDGKYYNTKKATLIAVSEYFCSYGHKRKAWFKSRTGIYFMVYQHVKKSYNLQAFQDLTVEQVITKEEIVCEVSFKDMQYYIETAEKGGDIVLNHGTYSFCILRNEVTPKGKLRIVNKPSEFVEVLEV